jgi:hypothetical protein
MEYGTFPGDHYAIWCDITFDSALGHNPPPLAPPQVQRLNLDHPPTVAKYQSTLTSQRLLHKLPSRLEALQNSILLNPPGAPLTPAQQLEADRIDSIDTQAMLHAAKKCRKLRMGMVEFSPLIADLRARITFWTLALKRRHGYHCSSRYWHRLKLHANVTEDLHLLSSAEVATRLKETFAQYSSAKKEHRKERDKFAKSNPHVKLLRTREEARRKGRIARLITGKLKTGGVEKLLSLDAYGNQVELTSKADIEHALRDNNKNNYLHSYGTPMLIQPLFADFGLTGDTPAAEEVLNGTYNPPPGTDIYARKFLQACRRPPEVSPTIMCPDTITTEEHIECCKKAKARTTGGKSGLTFAMFKANARDPQLAKFDATRRSISYSTGYSFTRYKSGLNVAIPKKANNFWLNKTRNILCLEADQNFNYKKLSRDVMRHAEQVGALAPDNFGGRRHHRAIEVSLNHRLTCDLLRQKRKAAILASTDAKGCFD